MLQLYAAVPQISECRLLQALLEDEDFKGVGNSAAVAAVGGIASANMYLFSLAAGGSQS